MPAPSPPPSPPHPSTRSGIVTPENLRQHKSIEAYFPMRRRQMLSLSLAPLALSFPDGVIASPRHRDIDNRRAVEAARKVLPGLRESMAKKGMTPGQPLFLRFYKESSRMEMWVQSKPGGEHELFRTWKVARWSGKLGPKLRMGDGQTPEGIYHTDLDSLNPLSKFHLSFNINYPNARDQHHGCTGNLIMVHGSNVSIGCYAMTDPAIEEIYTLVVMALGNGQALIPIHSFPFAMTEKRLERATRKDTEAAHLPFWNELAPAWRLFEESRRVPRVQIQEGKYVFSPA